MRYWVKLWTEMLDDPKMGRLTDRQHRLFTNLMCLAGIIDDDGRLLNTDDIAYKVRRDTDSVADDLDALATVNIVRYVDGAWYLINFGKRNERPPSAKPEAVKERVDRYREKQRECNEDVTTCNEDVTRVQRDVTSLEQEQIRSEADQSRGRQEAEQKSEPTKSQILPAAAPPDADACFADAVEALAGYGIEDGKAREVTANRGSGWVLAWCAEIARRGNLVKSPAGLIIKMAADGIGLPTNNSPPRVDDIAAWKASVLNGPYAGFTEH